MRGAIIFFFLVALILAALATAEANSEWTRRTSRFLAGRDLNGKCDMDPSVCYSAGSPGTSCCGQECVNVNSDIFNCGNAGGSASSRSRSCCGGNCVDLPSDKWHCGDCFHKCPNGVKCIYGLCNYA